MQTKGTAGAKVQMFLTLFIAVLALGCSKSIQLADPVGSAQEWLERGSGNGGHYDGKIEAGTYVRNVPSSKCGTQKLGQVLVTEKGITSTDLNTETCTESSVTVNAASIDYANYSPERLGLGEGIYIKEEMAPKEGEEVWCRTEDSNASVGFDVVIRAAVGDAPNVVHIVSAKNENGKIVRKEFTPFSVSRRLEMLERLEYETEDGGDFELEIRTSSRAQWAGTLSAETRIRREGFKIDTILRCRLGASLDPKYEGRSW